MIIWICHARWKFFYNQYNDYTISFTFNSKVGFVHVLCIWWLNVILIYNAFQLLEILFQRWYSVCIFFMYDNKSLMSSFEIEIAIKKAFCSWNFYKGRIWMRFAKHVIDDVFNKFKRQWQVLFIHAYDVIFNCAFLNSK